MTDILDLEGWNVVAKRVDGDDYLIEAEYTVPPKACTKCGNIGNLYKHGPKPIYIRDSPIRGRPVRILAHAQRFKCRECGGTFIQPLGGIHQDSRMTDYLPFVQDFVKNHPEGGQWGTVGDLQNSGLSKIGGKYFSQADLQAAMDAMQHPSKEAKNLDPAYFDMLTDGREVKDPLDKEFLNRLGFAEGGLVKENWEPIEADGILGYILR